MGAKKQGRGNDFDEAIAAVQEYVVEMRAERDRLRARTREARNALECVGFVESGDRLDESLVRAVLDAGGRHAERMDAAALHGEACIERIERRRKARKARK